MGRSRIGELHNPEGWPTGSRYDDWRPAVKKNQKKVACQFMKFLRIVTFVVEKMPNIYCPHNKSVVMNKILLLQKNNLGPLNRKTASSHDQENED